MEDIPNEQSNALFQDILENGANFTWPQYAQRHGLISGEAAQCRWKRHAVKNGLTVRLERKFEAKPPPPDPPEDETENIHSKTQEGNFITTDSCSTYLYSEADMAAFFKIDTDIWEVEKTTTNYWEQGAKIITKTRTLIAKTPLYQMKLVWRRKNLKIESAKEILASQIKLPDFQPLPIDISGRNLSLEIMITDHHLGKMGFDPETMEFNWTLPEAAEQYTKAIDYILSQVDVSRLAEIILPVGNDLLNVDNSSNQTRRGTPQMAGDFWHNVFRFGKQLVIASIEKLSIIAPVKVYMIKGNHDEDSVFSLGEVVDAYFSGNPNVQVTNHPVKRNYHEFGANMIGFAHGHEFNVNKVVQSMSTNEPLMFGRTRFRSFHLGHLHQNKINKMIDLSMKQEHFGVDVEICPSMSPTDEWHYKNAYIGNIRRTKAFLRHFEHGLIQEIYYNC